MAVPQEPDFFSATKHDFSLALTNFWRMYFKAFACISFSRITIFDIQLLAAYKPRHNYNAVEILLSTLHLRLNQSK